MEHKLPLSQEASIKMNQLNIDVITTSRALSIAQYNLTKFARLPENNRYRSMDEAKATIEDELTDRVYDDCYGMNTVGSDKYAQEFMIEEKTFIATLHVKYEKRMGQYRISQQTLQVEEKAPGDGGRD